MNVKIVSYFFYIFVYRLGGRRQSGSDNGIFFLVRTSFPFLSKNIIRVFTEKVIIVWAIMEISTYFAIVKKELHIILKNSDLV